jgi:hypothetical protein
MAHAPLDGALNQRMRVHRIVAVIAERIANRVRHHDRGGEMDNGVDPVLRDQRGHARLVTDVADDEQRALRYCPIETGREVVEHHDALAGVDERMNHVTSDIASAAGDQDCHAGDPLLSPGVAVRVSGTSGCGRACTCWRPLTSRQVPHGSGGAFDDARRPVAYFDSSAPA